MNQSDAERISAYLNKHKLKKASSIDEAGLIIFVTCGVRQSAEDRVYGQINNIKKKFQNKKIILTGCLAHRKDVRRRLKDKVDLFCGIKNFPKAVSPFLKGGLRGILKNNCNKINPSPALPLEKGESFDYLEIIPKYSNPYTAYIPIMTGCNNFCAYCVVPYARGREYSRPATDILKEVKSLVKKGYKEIVLLGQNVNSYYCHPERNPDGLVGMQPRDLCVLADSKLLLSREYSSTSLSTRSARSGSGRNDKIINFPKLLQLIEKIPGKFWLTFLTSHPKDMSGVLIETIVKSSKICEYVSLPAQSGDNEILRNMNRKYSIEHYKNLIKKIRHSYAETKSPIGDLVSKLPPAISTDIIVGFPGETKEQFENSAKLLRELKFDMAYIAQYSPRPETAAWKLKDNISRKEKERREKVLTEILSKTALANNKKYVGKIVEVLVDKKSPLIPLFERGKPDSLPFAKGGLERDFRYLAHTRTQKKVIFQSNKKIPIGSFVKVKIIKVKAFGLEGEKKQGSN